LQAAYFSWQWIIQEVLLAKRATVFWESQFIAWNVLELFIHNSWNGLNRPGGKFAFELAWKSLQIGTGWPLRDLLVRGRLYCHDFRDSIFSFVSLANDCVGLEEVIVDYSAEMWELFFGLLEIFRSSIVVSFAYSLHNLVEVPSLLLIEIFNSPIAESATATELQRLSQVFKMKVKGQKTSYGGNAELFDGFFGEDLEESDGLWEDPKLPDVEFYPICASLFENFGTLTMKIYECRISNWI
jgi:hypothetical protein